MPKIDVQRKEPDIDYYTEQLIEEMLKEGMTQFNDTRDYKVTIKNGKDYTETITANISITILRASQTLIEKAKEEEE